MSIPKSRWKNLLIALGWALAGAFLAVISAGAERPSGYLLSGFFLLGSITTLINLYRRPKALILTQEGFYNYTGVAEHGRQLVPWGLVGEISSEKSAQKIYVQLADVHTYKKNLTGCWAFMMQLHKDKDGLTIEISTTGMKLPPGVTRESLTQTMCDYRDKKIKSGSDFLRKISMEEDIDIEFERLNFEPCETEF